MKNRDKYLKVLENIERFQKIREVEYKNTPLITRVSAVLLDEAQNMNGMKKLWGSLVDQISFVKYNPWENVYQSPLSNVAEPCSDLWRRMFVWWDGKINPCDVDYKSVLSVGNINNSRVEDLWNSNEYTNLRSKHIKKNRSKLSPCKGCTVV